jgi:hypothetical protein
LQSLADYQIQLSRHLLAPQVEAIARTSPVLSRHSVALNIHRNTVFHALLTALEMSYPTIVCIIGAQSFEATAASYIRHTPPTSAILYEYGDRFPEHLARNFPEHGCLADLASFDLTIDRVGRVGLRGPGKRFQLAAATTLLLPDSLRCQRYGYAVDAVRDTLQTGVGEIGTQLIDRCARNLAIWRSAAGVSVKQLSEAAFLFVEFLMVHGDAAEAILRAAAHSGADRALAAIRGEVFDSSLARVISPAVSG